MHAAPDSQPTKKSAQSFSATTHKLPRWKSFLQNALLLGFSTLLSLLAAEVALRVWLSKRAGSTGNISALAKRSIPNGEKLLLGDIIKIHPNKNIVYELQPDRSGLFFDTPFSTNALGMRDRERTLAKPPNTFRVAGLGDSLMFGWRVEDDQHYLRLLEDFLNRTASAGQRFEVLNFGVPGYNTRIEAEVLREKALAFEPDLLLVHYCGNDLQPPSFLRVDPDFLTFRRVFFVEKLAEAAGWRASAGDQFVPRLVNAIEVWNMEAHDPNPEDFAPEYRHLVGQNPFAEGLDIISSEAKSRGLPLYFLQNWGLAEYGPDITSEIRRRNAEGNIAMATERGFQLIDAWPEEKAVADALALLFPRENTNRLIVAPDDRHPSRLGHFVIARAFYKKLVEDARLPDASERSPRLKQDLRDWARLMDEEQPAPAEGVSWADLFPGE